MISMTFSVSDNFSQHLAVTIASFVVNNPKDDFIFHVLHRNITLENQARIAALEKMYPTCRIQFHPVDAGMFDDFPIPVELEHITQEMYYRYLIADILKDESRTIYSDVDVLCRASIHALWELDLGDDILGAILEHKPNDGVFRRYKERLGMRADTSYFYSGFLLMDLEKIRAGGYVAKLFKNTAECGRLLAWPDQDIINLTFMDRIRSIDDTWNSTDRYNPFRTDVKTWHFSGFTLKPWCNIFKNITWIPYLKYLLKTPYRKNAPAFVWGHVKGFFYFKYTKKCVTRVLICGIRVWKGAGKQDKRAVKEA